MARSFLEVFFWERSHSFFEGTPFFWAWIFLGAMVFLGFFQKYSERDFFGSFSTLKRVVFWWYPFLLRPFSRAFFGGFFFDDGPKKPHFLRGGFLGRQHVGPPSKKISRWPSFERGFFVLPFEGS